METKRQWCDQKSCVDFGEIDRGNIIVHSDVDRSYYCTSSKHTFSADKGTFFETLRTNRQTLLDRVAMLVECHSLRAISRIKHCKLDTIGHWLDLAGQHVAAVSSHMIRSLHVAHAQIDELFGKGMYCSLTLARSWHEPSRSQICAGRGMLPLRLCAIVCSRTP